jgi:hypothetical protein
MVVKKPKVSEKILRDAFFRYFDVKRQMAVLKDEENNLKDLALEYAELFLCKDKQNVIVEDDNGNRASVVIAERPQYDYPEEIKALEEKLKRMKKEAEINGTAKVVGYTKYLVFRFEKDKVVTD